MNLTPFLAQQQREFVQGINTLVTTNPMVTAHNAVNAWNNLTHEDRLIAGAAMLASGPAAFARAGKLGTLGDVAPDGAARVANSATPYSARSVGNALEAKYPGGVTSRTLPSSFDTNAGLAGTRHPVSGIVFDNRGFPIFDDVAVFDTRIANKYSSVDNSSAHMRASTRDLRESIVRGEVNSSQFTPKQLRAIQGGKPQIPGFTWHHHQDIGRMQLIPSRVHQQTGHVGGYEMWFR